MPFPQVTFRLPDWMETHLSNADSVYPTLEERMRLVVDLSRMNIEHETGGPFGAAIFEISTHRLVAPGVNLVVSGRCSIAHAEMMAMMIAQQTIGSYHLREKGLLQYELVCSTEPCAMCLGAVHWSGINRLVCGAREEDARTIGFDEGPKPLDWVQSFEQRGIMVVSDICRQEAASVLQQYQKRGGIIYN